MTLSVVFGLVAHVMTSSPLFSTELFQTIQERSQVGVEKYYLWRSHDLKNRTCWEMRALHI